MTDRRILILRTVLLWILLELVAAAQVRTSGGELVLWSWVRASVSPVLWIAETIGTFVSDVATGVTESVNLTVANRELELELEASEALRQIMAEDMAALTELHLLSAAVPDLIDTVVPARLTYRNLAQGRMIAVTEGTVRMAPDTPAVATGGVIGRVIHSQGRRSWIEAITHPVAAVAVQTPDGLVQGLAVGSENQDLLVEFIPRQVELLRGITLVTSGADGIYPPGLPVCQVTAVRESASAFLEVRAQPTANLATVRVVFFIGVWGVEAGRLEPPG